MDNDRRKTDLNSEEVKSIMKEALKEWLDDKFSEFGKWSLGALMAALLAGVIIFILHMDGWQKVVGK